MICNCKKVTYFYMFSVFTGRYMRKGSFREFDPNSYPAYNLKHKIR